MPSRTIHLRFDKILESEGIIERNIGKDIIHDIMDGSEGSNHQILDKNHDPEEIRRKLRDGNPLVGAESDIWQKVTMWIRNQRLDGTTKTYLLRVAYGHQLLDNEWKNHKERNGDYPNNVASFLNKCFREYKVRDLDSKKI